MRIAQFFWLLLLFALTHAATAQNYVLSTDIPVQVSGQALTAAWAGGLTAPQLSAIDLDNDGRLDLVIFDRDGGWLLPFYNGGTVGEIDYTFAPAYMSIFPSALREWTLLRDFDADGFVDIFTAIPQVSNVRVYRNTSSSTGGSLSFALYTDTVQSNYPPLLDLFSSKSDLPAIDDVDGDGDLDLLTFQLGGNRVEWHRNTSIETTSGLLGMDFAVQSRCFGHFEEDALGCEPSIGRIPCAAGQRMDLPQEEKTAAHAGSTILSLDLDSNGLKDLVIGDIGCSSLYALYNGGTAQIADFTSRELNFPANTTPANVLLFPAAFFIDLDNDGIKDLAAAPNKADQVEDQKSIAFFTNVGTNGLPEFNYERVGILQDQMIDVGTASMPTFLDHNGDGLQDLLVGGAGRYDSLLGYHPLLALYENTGTGQQPAYELVSADYLQLRDHPAFTTATHLRPTAGDLDGDGDQDLLLGCADGTLYHFANTAPVGSPATFVLQTPNFAGIDVGLNSSPQLIDLDGDLDHDLLVGDHRGFVRYYRNDGSVSAPNYGLVTDSLGHVKVNNFTGLPSSNGYANPFACDYDHDLDLDLLVGGVDGEVQVYENLTLAPNATFQRVGDLFGRDFGTNAAVAAATLDSARLSFVVGDHRGGLTLWRDGGPVGMAPAHTHVLPDVQLFPNPAHTHVTFTIQGNSGAFNQYAIYDMLGRQHAFASFKTTTDTIDLTDLDAGFYVVVFSGRAGQCSRRLLVTR